MKPPADITSIVNTPAVPSLPWAILDVSDIGNPKTGREGFSLLSGNGKERLDAEILLPLGVPATLANFDAIATPLALASPHSSPELKEALLTGEICGDERYRINARQ